MHFSEDEIIGKQESLTWHRLLEEVRPLLADSGSQWIFRALGTWDGTNRRIPSSFDEAWERPSKTRKREDRRLYEAWMLLDFKREAHHYLTDLPPPANFLEWLALARHYEMPSRLVDFTYSFYVAAYFALSERKEQEDGCIVAINLTWMKDQVEKKLKREWCDKWKISFEQASFHNPGVFRKFAFESAEEYVVPVNPLRRNPRLARQHGLFLCPGNIEKDFDENLRNTLQETEGVKRLIRQRSNLRSEAIRDLDSMNISMATLYADLAGWAESRRDLVYRNIPDEDTFHKRFRQELEISLKNPRI